MPRKIKRSKEDIIDSLKNILENYKEINDLEDRLNQEKFLVNNNFQICINELKNIISKL